MIQFDRVSKHNPGCSRAVADVSFTIDLGSKVFLTGHSGAGTSTLLRLEMILEWASRGQVIVNDLNLSQAPDKVATQVRRGTGMIFQDHKLLKDKTVADNVALPLMIAGLKYVDIRKRVRAALDKVGLLEKENAWPLTLSGGEQQRVGIARGIVAMPPLILADEPTGNLDPSLSRELFGFFNEISRQGATVLIASHDLNLIRQMRKRVLVLSNGRLADDIPAGDGS